MTEQENEAGVVAEMAAAIIKAAGDGPVITINKYYPRGADRMIDGCLFGIGLFGAFGIWLTIFYLWEMIL